MLREEGAHTVKYRSKYGAVQSPESEHTATGLKLAPKLSIGKNGFIRKNI
jgi:hypothetical protein